jgi:hypothetical protein
MIVARLCTILSHTHVLSKQIYEKDVSVALKMLDTAHTVPQLQRILILMQNSLLLLIESVRDVQETEWNCIRCFKPLTMKDRLDELCLYHSKVRTYYNV